MKIAYDQTIKVLQDYTFVIYISYITFDRSRLDNHVLLPIEVDACDSGS